MFDVIVVGAGPAGLAAATFAARRKLRTLVLEASSTAGGKPVLVYANKIVDDLIGFPEGITGMEIGRMLEKHARKFGVEIKCNARVTEITPLEGGGFVLKDDKGDEYLAKAVIIAFGMQPRTHVGVKGEAMFRGKGVRYMLGDPSEVDGKKVIVVGGGETAVETALMASEKASSVHLVHRRDMLRADEALIERLIGRVDVMYNTIVEELRGEERLEEALLYNLESRKRRVFKVDEVIFCVGYLPATEILKKLGVKLSEKGEVVVNRKQETSINGLFAAGDVTGGVMRISTAIGEGVVASLSAYNYIKKPYWGE